MAIRCEKIFDVFKANDIVYFTGVPDSTFKQWMSYLADNSDRLTNRIAANEGAAIAHATGYHLATGKVGVVYMQNAGLGNCVDPLTSLTNSEVFGIPMILMVGWRGDPDTEDEPQHQKMGIVMLPLLEVLGISYQVLDERKIPEQIKTAKEIAVHESTPVALIVRAGFFDDYRDGSAGDDTALVSREEVLKAIVDTFDGSEVVVATTGKGSRELFEYREVKKQGHGDDFYMVGSMGHAAAVAMEIAQQKPEKKVYIFDGDGALIMHTGTLATIGNYAPKNLVHIVFDNISHESTGGQPTVSATMDIAALAKSCGYRIAVNCNKVDDLLRALQGIDQGPALITIRIRRGSRGDLGRPSITPAENKKAFMRKLSGET